MISDSKPQPRHQPTWPEIRQAVVAFQRGQGVNMNLVGPFRGQGWFRLLPADRSATVEDVRRFALHTTESLKAHRLDPSEPLQPMATHKQGFRQKREAVSLLRRWLWGRLQEPGSAQERELRRLLARAVAGELELLCWCHPLPCHAEVVRGAVLWLAGGGRD